MMKNLYIKEIIKECKHFIHFIKGLFEAHRLSNPDFPKQLLDIGGLIWDAFQLKGIKWDSGIVCKRIYIAWF